MPSNCLDSVLRRGYLVDFLANEIPSNWEGRSVLQPMHVKPSIKAKNSFSLHSLKISDL